MSGEIRRLRTASVLKQLIPEALSGLSDPDLQGLCVVDVECKKGRYDAFVYLDKMAFDEDEQILVLKKLDKVNGYLQNYCKEAEGWFRSPKFHFKFDDKLEYQNHMDELFKRAANSLKKDIND
ncbi:30S ribosome-binding factor RbfA [Campylobacter ureolyticus]|uniref:Ribosome-binding factor A n=1 Tax=Campylobacter ureolyticus TaxID=827 RepID=A0A2I1NBV8_9BACT|nr:30S ribosome-binding factor RbfA [Campylobacter ureolyticus]MCZ6150139.1 30S ribosome-binding factor RbfA [Campylobacter ureolyticus]MCZ6156747.1 30S ribosome-binding factor RbfA [Campylobacter ureolyticus]MCZ6159497.1 30S ribosome-binding factor RbfA [Campylobacter ureolyticus]MCZ6163598.1 30S ribosome-binding factor RbfA [Campylobacter ureolyticus]MCZ6165320.1 30S ribosome-binding factor RbfA [Campylobacter ureolyticus]